MHKIFGIKEEKATYLDRPGAYLIPVKNGKIGLIRTPKGLFLLGGGKENDETDVQTICRECLEETGCTAVVGKLICTAETYALHPEIGYFHPVQSYYSGQVSEPKQMSQESDHVLEWHDIESVKGKLFVTMQNWALEQYILSKIT